MKLEDIIDVIAFRLGNVRNMNEMIKMEIKASIARLENRDFYPWFLLSENNVYEAQPGEGRIPLPQDFLMEFEEGALFRHDSNGSVTVLSKKTFEELREEFTPDLGTPESYALTNKFFRLFPVPDKPCRVEMLFYRRTKDVEVQDNPWLEEASELIMAETLWAICMARKDKVAEYWRNIMATEYALLERKHETRMHTNREITFGGDY